jgi:hypothetical protein
MKLSDHLKQIQVVIDVYGDIEIKKYDFENGIDDLEPPQIMRQINGSYFNQQNYDAIVICQKPRDVIVDQINSSWTKMRAQDRKYWANKDEFVRSSMVGYNYNQAVIDGWNTAPIFLVL